MRPIVTETSKDGNQNSASHNQFMEGKLIVSVLAARELKNNSGYPYVTIQVGTPDNFTQDTTDIIPKNQNPVYNQEFIFYITDRQICPSSQKTQEQAQKPEKATQCVRFVVKDWNKFLLDTYIGEAAIFLDDICSLGKYEEFDLPLGKNRGFLRVDVCLQPNYAPRKISMAPKSIADSESSPLVDPNTVTEDSGNLKITILGTQELKANPEYGSRSAYVSVRLLSGPVQKTDTVYHNLLPRWKQSFTFRIRDWSEEKVFFEVRDGDKYGQDELMATSDTDLDELALCYPHDNGRLHYGTVMYSMEWDPDLNKKTLPTQKRVIDLIAQGDIQHVDQFL